MMIPVRQLAGLGSIPRHRQSATEWLVRHSVPLSWTEGKGGKRAVVELPQSPSGGPASNAPARMRRCRPAAMTRTPSRRRPRCGRRGGDCPVPADHPRPCRVAETAGDGAGEVRCQGRLEAEPEAAAGGREGGRSDQLRAGPAARLPLDHAAGAGLGRGVVVLHDHDPRCRAGVPAQQAWRDVRDVAKVRGWDWPSFPTIYRRWAALPEADKLYARHGREKPASV